MIFAHFESLGSSSRHYRFALSETILNQSVQFEVQGMFAGNILGQMGSAIMVYFGVRQLFELWGGMRCAIG